MSYVWVYTISARGNLGLGLEMRFLWLTVLSYQNLGLSCCYEATDFLKNAKGCSLYSYIFHRTVDTYEEPAMTCLLRFRPFI